MAYALIYKDRIAQVVIKKEETFPVHEDLIWVEVPDDTVAGFDTWQDGKIIKAVPYAPLEIDPKYKYIVNEKLDTETKILQDQIDQIKK